MSSARQHTSTSVIGTYYFLNILKQLVQKKTSQNYSTVPT